MLKILDFGISKAMGTEAGGSASEGAALTKSGAVFGTPLYMAPEQAPGDHGSVGPATDQWPIALIAFRLLTGEDYWQAETFADLVVRIVMEPLVAPSARAPALSAAFDAWFARSCERSPTARFASIGEQARALAVALGMEAEPAMPVPEIAAPPEPAVVEPLVAPANTGDVAVTASPLSRTNPVPLRRSPLPAIAIVVVALGAAGAFFFLRARGHGEEPVPPIESAPAAAASEVATLPAAEPVTPEAAPSASLSASAAATASPPVVAPRRVPRSAAEAKTPRSVAAEPTRSAPAAASTPAKPYAPVSP
jgi:eukaryotic-like serine/threonine-protein kinase